MSKEEVRNGLDERRGVSDGGSEDGPFGTIRKGMGPLDLHEIASRVQSQQPVDCVHTKMAYESSGSI